MVSYEIFYLFKVCLLIVRDSSRIRPVVDRSQIYYFIAGALKSSGLVEFMILRLCSDRLSRQKLSLLTRPYTANYRIDYPFND